MSLLLHLYPGDKVVLLAISVLVQVTVVILVAWMLSKIGFRRHAAVRHGLWLAALILVLLSPATVILMDALNVRIVAVSLPKFLTADEERAEVVKLPNNNHGALNSAALTSEKLASGPFSDQLPVDFRKGAHDARLAQEYASHDAAPSAALPPIPLPAAAQAHEKVAPAVSAPPVPRISTLARLRTAASAVLAIWFTGVIYGFVRFCHSGLALRRLIKLAQPGDHDLRLRSIMGQIERHLSLKKMPPVLVWRDAKLQITPLTIGIFRPVVVLSKSLLESLTPEELREVLVHECAHVLRRDSAVGLLQRIAMIVFWPYPLVMLLNRQLTLAREEVCDNYVLLHSSGPQYAQTLFDLSERIQPLCPNLAPVGLFQHRCPLEKRVAGLLDMRRNVMTKINRWAALCMAIIFLTIALAAAGARISMASLKAEEVQSSEEKKTDRPKEKADADQIAKNAPDAILRRKVNKLVKDFPEKTDLSTPETALAAYHRATAKKDTKAVLELGWRKYGEREIEEMERFWKSDSPQEMDVYLQAVLDAEVREVLTYRDDLAEVISKLKFPEGVGRDPFSARVFGRINGQWKNLGEDRLPSLEAARLNFEKKKDFLWKDFLDVKDIDSGKKPQVQKTNEVKLPPDKYEAVKATTPDAEKLLLMGLVENFFDHNARDITARKTLEWGDVKKNEDGSRSIRYKFEARIWDKETMIADQIFTFDKDNVILSYKDASGLPVKKEPKKVDLESKEGMMALVEDFFANNFRDITSRETIEWGDVEKDKDGNSSIRYKYEATIWSKDIQIMNQIFTFDKKGEFVRVKDVEGFPQKVEKKSENKKTTAPLLKGVNLSPEEIDKRWSWVFESPNAKKEMSWGDLGIRSKYVKASLDVARAELKLSEDANKQVPGSVSKLVLQQLKLEVDLLSRKHEYCIAVEEGDEKAVSRIALHYAESNVGYRQIELDLGKQSSKTTPGSTPAKDIERFELQVALAKIDLETVKMILEGDNNARQKVSKHRAEVEAKLQAVQPKNKAKK